VIKQYIQVMDASKNRLILIFGILIIAGVLQATGQSWTADNGNGTYTNPLFFDEFSDPDMIRVGNDFYLTGTTMHCMPGLPVLHSKDLVNWEFLGYAFDTLNLGDEYNLENGREAYGQGIWAPCIRYHNGKFYIFSNVNGHGMQVYMATDPRGPWMHKPLVSKIYDLSVLFDEDGKIYAVYNYDEVRLVELKPDMSGVVEGTERVIIPHGNNMGEGHHMYKINGKYYIISANYSPVGRMQCARADKPYGPYETVVISTEETMGTRRGWWVSNVGKTVPEPGFVFKLTPPGNNDFGAVPMHQGGIVDLPDGDWWGFSMMDFMSVGRTTFLSPVTWQDGWPYFGIPGNLGRSPRTWIKPNISVSSKPEAAYERSDDFSGPSLKPVWQWNHNPDNSKWELNKKRGSLRMHTLPAKDFLWAKNTLTQRVIGPASSATIILDASALKTGDYAGLAILNMPYAGVGIARDEDGYILRFYDQYRNRTIEEKLASGKVNLRITGNYELDIAQFSYSTDGNSFINIGDSILLPYQLKTFQGSRYALFAYNTAGQSGGYADFEDFKLVEPLADRSANIPLGKVITFTNLSTSLPFWANPHGMLHSANLGSVEFNSPGCRFRVHDRGKGRVALEALNGTGFITVVGIGISGDVRLMKEDPEGSLFQWQDMLHNQCMLLSLKTNRYIGLIPGSGEPYSANYPGTLPSRKDGTVLFWKVINE
jgi:xylan 1,4-beta-xylosidase